MEPRFLIREARPRDLSALYELAQYLDSYNLPAHRGRLARLIDDSQQSFAGQRIARVREKYLFVLEDQSKNRVVGCSMIIAKHGTPGFPHLSLACFEERWTSRTLKRDVVHQCLKLRSTSNGPTELGGLVLLPRYRGCPEKLAQGLSYVRLLWIAAHRSRFQKTLLAEYMPVFLKGRQSPFWEYFGRKFTKMSYAQADRLSIDNKEFILALFPRGTLYRDFFPESVNAYLGQVGEQTKPAARLLSKVGFRYNHEIEPFDGGPYYQAATHDVSLVREARQSSLRPVAQARPTSNRLVLVPLPQGCRAWWGPVGFRNGKMEIPSSLPLVGEMGDSRAAWHVPWRSS